MKRRKPFTNRKGFTLMEMLVVIVIIAILAAISAPYIMAFIQDGRQTNRTYIARTVYLGAQSRLTELRVTKNLKADLTKQYYDITTDAQTGETIYTEKAKDDLLAMSTNVYSALQNNGANADDVLAEEVRLGNEPYVHYIKKDRGNTDPDNPVVKLLDPVIEDKGTLSDAILIEYNIRTGVVLSVFYGDSADTASLKYEEGGRANVVGNRGMNETGYQYAQERRQGYYGVDQTGSIEDPIPAVINVYDSSERRLPDDDKIDGTSQYQNVLYAEIYVPKKDVVPGNLFDLSINGVVVEQGVDLSKYTRAENVYTKVFNNLFPTVPSDPTDAQNDLLLYNYNGSSALDAIDPTMQRYVWILDYVGGNMSYYLEGESKETLLTHSIGIKYRGQQDAYDATKTLTLDGRSPIYVSISGSASAESETEAHPFYASDMVSNYSKNNFNLVTARHLYNVHYLLNGNFTLKNDIDLEDFDNGISNFDPIGYKYTYSLNNWGVSAAPFTGDFNGDQHAISNLRIRLPEDTRVGLFSMLSSQSASDKSSIRNLSLYNPSVLGKDQVGALLGTSKGMVDSIIVSYPEDSAKTEDGGKEIISGTISGESTVGGIIGSADQGLMTDLVFISPNAKQHVVARGNDAKGTAGGLVGLLDSVADKNLKLANAFFLALAPQSGDTLQPFVGGDSKADTTANTAKLYYLSGKVSEESRPTVAKMAGIDQYNVGTVNVGLPMSTVDFYEMSLLTQMSLKWTRANNLTEALVLDLKNTIYPYPYAIPLTKAQPKYPNWPIVESEDKTAPVRTVYYEVYADDGNAKTTEYGFFDPLGMGKDKLTPLQDDRKILEDGYLFVCSKPENLDIIQKELTDRKLALTISSGVATSNYVTANKLTDYIKAEKDIAKLGGISGVLLNVSKLEECALGAKTVYVTLGKTTGGDPYISTYMNPLFAKGIFDEAQNGIATPYSVRTPRQMKNIAKTDTIASVGDRRTAFTSPLTANYIQEVDIDFGGMNSNKGYQKRNYVTDASYVNISTTESVVASGLQPFRGVYEGNKKACMNVNLAMLTAIPTKKTLALFDSNGGTIQNLSVLGSTFSMAVNQGGVNIASVAAQNTGNMDQITVDQCVFKSTNAGPLQSFNIGGVVGFNNKGSIEHVTVSNSTFTGIPVMSGGVAALNQTGSISFATVENMKVTYEGYVECGGIVGANQGDRNGNGKIANTEVKNSTIAVTDGVVGGIAGNNLGTVSTSSVQYSTVDGKNAITGGIAGTNQNATSSIRDVYFLSVAKTEAVPVVGGADIGGIVANNMNAAKLENALYIAPAPTTGAGDAAIMSPIVGKNSDTWPTGNFYLQGSRYSVDNGVTWIEQKYNRTKLSTKDTSKGLYSRSMEKEWLNFAYKANFGDTWYQPAAGYLYPLIVQTQKPDYWPVTDGPIRPNQAVREDWATQEPTSNRSGIVDFINGDFELPLMNPDDTTQTYPIRDPINTNLWTVLPNPPVVPETTPDNVYGYFPYLWVQGWNTRPTNAADAGKIWWEQIELQQPRPNGLPIETPTGSGRVLYDYKGGKNGIYAELNAHYPNTLYQICKTIPGTEMFYSFYHASRSPRNLESEENSMNFMLTDVVLQDGNWVPRKGENTIIRPCRTPRNIVPKGLLAPGVQASLMKKPVYYAKDPDFPAVPVKKNKFYDPNTKTIKEGYLYDVWLEDLGYGVTFWTEDGYFWDGVSGNYARPPWYSDQTQVPHNLDELKRLVKNQWDRFGDVIGYWDVKQPDGAIGDWKHYYGLYDVPTGQVSTEFAFEAVKGSFVEIGQGPSPTSGNYLDGISFKTPAFLSISKNIKSNGRDVNFAKPGEILDVELHIKSWGEVAAGNISVEDQLKPFDEYASFVEGSVKVYDADNADGTAGTDITNRCTVSMPDSTDASDKQTLTVKMPSDLTRSNNETIKVTFQMKVRETLKSNKDIDTLLYYFQNQAVVKYGDTEFTAYQNTKRSNGSNIVKVSIEPLKLNKTITVPDGGLPIDGPFTVNLRIEATVDGLETRGIVSDSIPSGFKLTDRGNLPSDVTLDENADGSTRLTIKDVNLATGISLMEYNYTITYTGSGYGVHVSSNGTDYKYLYTSGYDSFDVMTPFPQTVVGLRVKTAADTCAVTGRTPKTFDLTVNDNFQSDYINDKNHFAHQDYNVIPVMVLTDADGKPMPTNADGNYIAQTDAYAAVLIKSTGELQVTPKTNADGNFKLYYKIALTATKPGGNPASMDLSSPVTEIDLSIKDSDKVLYFEKYKDATGADVYGFFTGEQKQSLPALRDDLEIVETGYGALTQEAGRTVRFGPAAKPEMENFITDKDGVGDINNIIDSEQIEGVGFLYKLTKPAARLEATDYDLTNLYVKINNGGFMDQIAARIYPNFAKGIYKATVTDAGNTFYIRTPKQMQNISLLTDTTGKTFVQERVLDFAAETLLGRDGAVVKGIFKGTYDGKSLEIKNLKIITSPGSDNVGLFSQNAGTIQDVVVTEGVLDGKDFVGTIAGQNEVTGIIKNAKVSNVKITATGDRGALVGKNNNPTSGSVTGSATGMSGVGDMTALALALAEPFASPSSPETTTDTGVARFPSPIPDLTPEGILRLTPPSALNSERGQRYRRRRGASQ